MREDEDAKIIAADLLTYDEVPQENQETRKLWVKVPKNKPIPPSRITDVLAGFKGDTQVMIYNEAQNRSFLADRSYWVSPSDGLTRALEDLLGPGTVKITAK